MNVWHVLMELRWQEVIEAVDTGVHQLWRQMNLKALKMAGSVEHMKFLVVLHHSSAKEASMLTY